MFQKDKIRPNTGEVISSPYEITYTEQSVSKFVNQILSLGDETRVVMEATGIYHIPLLISLNEAGIFVSVINPLVMKKYVSTSIRKGKADKLDSVRIANYGLDNWFHLENFTHQEGNYEELKILGRQ